MQQTANMKDPVSLYIKLCDSTHYATNLRVKHILYPAKYNVRQADTLWYCLPWTLSCIPLCYSFFICFVSNQANQPTPWSRVILEKLTVPWLVKKFPAFYAISMFITMVTKDYQLFLSWTRLIQSLSSHPTCLISILILPPVYDQVFQVVIFTGVSPPKTCMHFSTPQPTVTCPTHHATPWFDHQNNIQWEVQTMTLLIIQFSPVSCHFLYLRSKYLHQHPVLTHHQSIFAPQGATLSFTPISNKSNEAQLQNQVICTRWESDS